MSSTGCVYVVFRQEVAVTSALCRICNRICQLYIMHMFCCRDEEELFAAEGIKLTDAERRRAEIGREVCDGVALSWSNANLDTDCIHAHDCWLSHRC